MRWDQGPIKNLSSAGEKPYRIYALIDPDTRFAHYVGQTANTLHLRLLEHTKKPGSTRKGEWVRSLTASGRAPQIVLLEEIVGTRGRAYERERYWIDRLRNEGNPILN